jgi:hypothetical protein
VNSHKLTTASVPWTGLSEGTIQSPHPFHWNFRQVLLSLLIVFTAVMAERETVWATTRDADIQMVGLMTDTWNDQQKD